MRAFGLALMEVQSEMGTNQTTMDVLDDTSMEFPRFSSGESGGTSVRPITMVYPTGPAKETAAAPSDPTALFGVTALRVTPSDATMLKPGRQSGSAPDDKTTVMESNEVETPKPPSSKVKLIAILGAAALVVALIVGLLIAGNPGTTGVDISPPPPTANPQDPGGVDIPLAPQDVTGTINFDTETVTFTWTNPAPVEGDHYRVVTMGSNKVEITDLPSIEVPMAEGQAWTCINVQVLRSGLASTQVQACA
jgi:hypothetical protein